MASRNSADRWRVIQNELARVDGMVPSKETPIEKHHKMARSPFQFLRGSAQLFYADLASGEIALPDPLHAVPLTHIEGDCHFSNFGFFTEEGSHSNTVIWAPNDFDDACVGQGGFDLLRFITSLHLVGDFLGGLKEGRYQSEELETPTDLIGPSSAAVTKAAKCFLDSYCDALEDIVDTLAARDEALDQFKKKHFLASHHAKARQRAAGGRKFLDKSTVGKLAALSDGKLAFKSPHEKLKPLEEARRKSVEFALRPYVDDEILDVALRLGAGTGSVNVERFYLLVGPAGEITQETLPLCHVVEVKQQREAAMIHHFPDLSPVNRQSPAHLTVDSQRRMMRRPDLILDDLDWQGHHWLVRSRHHARYGVDPEDILLAENPDKAFVQYAKACGDSLARAHSRGDRRSTLFEAAMLKALDKSGGDLLEAGERYSQQVMVDHGLLQDVLRT